MSVQCKASMGADVKEALESFQVDVGLFREGYSYLTEPEVSRRVAQNYMDRFPEFYFLEGWGTPLSIFNECSLPMKENETKTHGGKRAGAGRKKGTPSKLVRVPVPLMGFVSDSVTAFKTGASEHISLCCLCEYFEVIGFTVEHRTGTDRVRVYNQELEFISESTNHCFKEVKDELMGYLVRSGKVESFYCWAFENERIAFSIQ